jgi:hypothetical protein
MRPNPQNWCFFRIDFPAAWRSPSQHPASQRNLADQAAHQEAEREHEEHRDAKFEQGILRHRGESQGHTHYHRGMGRVDRVGTGAYAFGQPTLAIPALPKEHKRAETHAHDQERFLHGHHQRLPVEPTQKVGERHSYCPAKRHHGDRPENSDECNQ